MNYLSKSKNLFNCITTTAVERDKTYHDNTQLVYSTTKVMVIRWQLPKLHLVYQIMSSVSSPAFISSATALSNRSNLTEKIPWIYPWHAQMFRILVRKFDHYTRISLQ
jgi:hypothetical protein